MRRIIPNHFLSGLELAERLTEELLRDESTDCRSALPFCRYQGCPGRSYGAPEAHRLARVKLTLGPTVWHVCESCADQLTRTRPEGTRVRREQLS